MQRKSLIFIGVLFISFFLVWQAVFAKFENQVLEVNFFDTGEGDSILIELPGEQQILIDGGPTTDVVGKIAKEMPFFDRTIEVVISTHSDKDHITGLFEVLETFKVDKIFIPEIKLENKSNESYFLLREIAQRLGTEIFVAKAGQKISFSNSSLFSILWPEPGFVSSKTNDFSIVGKFSFGKLDFLFTGDASKDIEYELLAENLEDSFLGSEILKIAHHGSKYSTSEEFIKEVLPKIAVISVGENRYGHPDEEVLKNLQRYDIKTLRTDENGDIKIISNGESFEVQSEK